MSAIQLWSLQALQKDLFSVSSEPDAPHCIPSVVIFITESVATHQRANITCISLLRIAAHGSPNVVRILRSL